ncbi:YggS family pyridoxal phosphate enzyme [Enterococcus sp. JM4C]|uniref:YggS family pyridoxal phosphate-dependent enzyme n=1 Tax=Candidatus Enterococcus huntleyi TaxID=1857217 RepID=UPI0013799DF3|nr:YggS family pyridoxal phosphate-dependent enzyme [Enterococcus sp. JM4C]KAF1297154.1 YggS family pyridoxal phosphate enzyme [Enterococcus sp. JM4C]
MITDNLWEIRQAIQDSCAFAHRNPEEVTLIAVTKTVDSAAAKVLVEAGITDLAENRVDKLLEKQYNLKDEPQIKWHLIGNLQRRKVKSIINQIDYFHALDSLSLAAEIDKRAEKVISCFVEVNVSGEASKHGITPDELLPFIDQLSQYSAIKVVGLMTMAPYEANEQEIRDIFNRLKILQEDVRQRTLAHAPCTELSMGMSNDFPIAIEEGSTFIRIGTALFKDA